MQAAELPEPEDLHPPQCLDCPTLNLSCHQAGAFPSFCSVWVHVKKKNKNLIFPWTFISISETIFEAQLLKFPFPSYFLYKETV